jgi:iron complex transport system permease protein
MKPFLRLVCLLGILTVMLLLSLRLGAVGLGVGEIIGALRGVGDPVTVSIVRGLRLPRSLQAAAVGGALSASGATFQALLRNPLAEPYILGISGGAAVGAVAAVVLGGSAWAGWVVPSAAFAGALLAIWLVFMIAVSATRVLDSRTLLLAGVVVGAFFNACILLLLTLAEPESFQSALFWIMGSFSGTTWGGLGITAVSLVPPLILLIALARPLNLLSLGEETAACLGVRVERTKLLAYGAASLLTGAAVAVSGVIGFVGLIIPHCVRFLWGSDHRFLLPASVVMGAIFLVVTDALARSIAAPTELPIGVITSFLGVPFFVWLLRGKQT